MSQNLLAIPDECPGDRNLGNRQAGVHWASLPPGVEPRLLRGRHEVKMEEKGLVPET